MHKNDAVWEHWRREGHDPRVAATAVLEQGPREFVYVSIKEGPKELVPRRGLVSGSFTTYLDLAESALRSSSAEDWELLQSYPMMVETFSDHNETQQSLAVVATGARQRRIQTITVGYARAVPFPKS